MQLRSDPAARLDRLLLKTSRTFALSIPCLPQPVRRQVTAAYLLFRIADTLEDATLWEPCRQAQELSAFARVVAGEANLDAREIARGWLREPPLEQADYLELLGDAGLVLSELQAMPPRVAEIVRQHTLRTVESMTGYVLRPRPIRLQSLDELKAYCYAVAGIVGEMLTELFLDSEAGLLPVAEELRRRSVPFGEALQLVNILKDAAADALEGRRYMPPDTPRESLFALARSDLRRAAEYVRLLQHGGARRGIVEFNALPVMLAWFSLDRIEAGGPGAKLTRAEVFAAVATLGESLDAGRPLFEERLGAD